jgi:hypothetical protein
VGDVLETKRLVCELDEILGGVTLATLLESPRVSPRTEEGKDNDDGCVVAGRKGPLSSKAPPALEFVSQKQFTKIKKNASPKAKDSASPTKAGNNVNWAENHKLRLKIRDLKAERARNLEENEILKKDMESARKHVESLRKIVESQKKELKKLKSSDNVGKLNIYNTT